MKVLIVGRRQDLLDTALAQVRAAGFEAEGSRDDDEIIAQLRGGGWNVLAIGGGVDPDAKVKFRQVVADHSPATHVLEVYGPETLLPGLKQLREHE